MKELSILDFRKLILPVLFFLIIISSEYGISSANAKSSLDYQYSAEQIKGLDYLNSIREKIGLNKVMLNPYISKAAENHAKYVVKNNTAWTGLSAHSEKEGIPGFTGVDPSDRVRAVGGKENVGEVITFVGNNAKDAIDSWMDTAYHRSLIIDPNTKEIGIGFYGNTTVLNMTFEGESHDVSVFPYPNMKNVDIGFYGGELPDPLKQFKINYSGYIISFQSDFEVRSFKVTIRNSRNETVPFYSEKSGLTWFFFPKNKLDFDEKYTVKVNYEPINSEEKVGTKTWSFTTEKSTSYEMVKLNGKFIALDPANIKKGEAYLPLVILFKRLNNDVSYDKKTKTYTLKNKENTVHLTLGSKTAKINGKKITLSRAPYFDSEYEESYIPLGVLKKLYGAKIRWDKKKNLISINMKVAEPDQAEDLIKDLFAKPIAKRDKIFNILKGITTKYEYTIEEENTFFNYTIFLYLIKDQTGKTVTEIYLDLDSNFNNESTLSFGLKELLVPQNNKKPFQYIQEVTEQLTGKKANNLATTLMETFSSAPSLDEEWSKVIKINDFVECNLYYGYSYIYTDSYGNEDCVWEGEVNINF